MTERIFEVEISNKTSKGYETATALEMPATWAEFHDALEKARIKDARDCHNELTKIEYPGIQRGMIGDNVNLYELNLLAQRLAMLSEDDRMGLDGLLQIEGGRHIGPIPLPRLINLTYNADICLLAPHVFNNQQLGALLYESGMLTQEAPVRLDIHFLKECRFGQMLTVGCEQRERSALFEISGDGAAAAVRASIEWK